MKKITSALLVSLLLISTAFSYTPTQKDELISNGLNTTIKNKHSDKIENLQKNLPNVISNYKKDDQTKWLLIELQKYLENIKINNEAEIIEEIVLESKNEEETNTENLLYSVVSIIDGDTIKINYEGENINIRMIGIDAPENSITRYGYVENYGDEAKEKLQKFIGNNQITIELDESQLKYDKYNRLLAYVFVGNININQKMIEIGYANEYTYNKPYKYQTEFKQAQIKAQKNKIGIWEELEEENTNIHQNSSSSSNSFSTPSYCKNGPYYVGSKGGCYYYNSKGNKAYEPGCCN